MGASSSNEISEYQENHTKIEAKTEQKYIEQEKTKIENISGIFREEEIALINQKKLKIAQSKSVENNKNIIYPLYQKIKVDLSNQAKTVTNYMVLYVPKDYSQLKSMKYIYHLIYNNTNFTFKEKYNLVSSSPKTTTGYGYLPREDDEVMENLPCISANIEFIITEKDIKNEFITLTTTYTFDFESFYGLHEFNISFGKENKNFDVPKSALFIINDDYIIDNGSNNKLEESNSVNKNKELFLFNNNSFEMHIKDKNPKIDIRNEVNEELLLNFSDKDIELINFTLNLRKWKFGCDNFIYLKTIHNIKNNKNYIKLYYVVFSPTLYGKDGMGVEHYFGEDGQELIIIKEFKINGIKVKKGEEAEDNIENKFGYYGYFISDEYQHKFEHSFRNTFSICELDCESNENINYFLLDFTNFISGLNFDFGSSFSYEILLNGNSIKFSDKNFKYQIKNDKIIFDGYLDDYDEQKYIEIAKKTDKPKYYLELSNEDRRSEWKYMRKDDLIPYKMELI